MAKYFFAYGTNITQTELDKHCPGAILIGYGMLNNYMLEFRGYTGHAIAHLTKKKGEVLPITIWELPPESKFTIENYEKFPYMYKKVKMKAIMNGKKIKGIVYLATQELPEAMPSEEYLSVLKQAYNEADFDEYYINNAIERLKNCEDEI